MDRPIKRRRILSPDQDLNQLRAWNDARLKTTFESIFEKYGRDFNGVGDEIDLRTGEIVVNNGHLLGMVDEKHAGVDGDMLDELNGEERSDDLEVRVKPNQNKGTTRIDQKSEDRAVSDTTWLSDDADSLMGDVILECSPVVVTGGIQESRQSNVRLGSEADGFLPSAMSYPNGGLSNIARLAAYSDLANARNQQDLQAPPEEANAIESVWRAPPLPEPASRVQPVPVFPNSTQAKKERSLSPPGLSLWGPEGRQHKSLATKPSDTYQKPTMKSEPTLALSQSQKQNPNLTSLGLEGARGSGARHSGKLRIVRPVSKVNDKVQIEPLPMENKRKIIKSRWTQQEDDLLFHLWSDTDLGPMEINKQFRRQFPRRSFRATNDHRLCLHRKHSWRKVPRETARTAPIVKSSAGENNVIRLSKMEQECCRLHLSKASPFSSGILPNHTPVGPGTTIQDKRHSQRKITIRSQGIRQKLTAEDMPRSNLDYAIESPYRSLHKQPRSLSGGFKSSNDNKRFGEGAQGNEVHIPGLSNSPTKEKATPKSTAQNASRLLRSSSSKTICPDSNLSFDSTIQRKASLVLEGHNTCIAGATHAPTKLVIHQVTKSPGNSGKTVGLITPEKADAEKRQPVRQRTSDANRPPGLDFKATSNIDTREVGKIGRETKSARPLSNGVVEASEDVSHSTSLLELPRPQASSKKRTSPNIHNRNSHSLSANGKPHPKSKFRPPVNNNGPQTLLKTPDHAQSKSVGNTKSGPSQVKGNTAATDRKTLSSIKQSVPGQRFPNHSVKFETSRSLMQLTSPEPSISILGRQQSLSTPSQKKRHLQRAICTSAKPFPSNTEDLSDDELSVCQKTVGTAQTSKIVPSILVNRRKTLG